MIRRTVCVVLLAVAALSAPALAEEAPSPFDPDRPAIDRQLPVAPAAPPGPIRIPRDLILKIMREVEPEVMPDDRPGNPAFAPRIGPVVGRRPPEGDVLNAFGPNVRINSLAGAPAGNAESEVSVAGIGSKLIAGWNDGQFFGSQPGFTGWGYSIDGGASWTDAGGLPLASAADVYYGDPVVVADPGGHFYFANLYRPVPGEFGISVSHGTFAGAVPVWDPPVTIDSDPLDFLDKPWLGVDPVTGYVYVAYIRFFDAGGQQLEFARSTNRGVTWSTPVALTSSATSAVMSPRIMVALGGAVHLAYFSYNFGDGQPYHRLRTSVDYGVTFGPESDIGGLNHYNNFYSGPPGYNRERQVALVSLAVDRTGGANDGRLYSVWEEMVRIDDDVLGGAVVPEVEANGSAATATPFAVGGTTLSGSLSSTADQDWWSFAGTAGQTVIFYLVPNASPCNGFLRMFAGGGATANRCAFSSFGGGTAVIVFTLPSTATYYVRVLNADGVAGNIGPYYVYTSLHVPHALDVSRDHRDVLFSTSPDAGATWSPPIVVNDEPGRFDSTFPEVAVDGAGTVYVSWYDRRNDPANGILTDIYYTSSADQGATWAPSAIVNDGGSVNWNLVTTNAFPNMGDYSALVSDGLLKVYANWADGRGGTPDSWFASLTGTPTAVEPLVRDGGSWPALRAIPNPVLDEARFPVSRELASHLRLVIFDHAGRRVRALDRTGRDVYVWDRRDDQGHPVPPGIYLHRLEGQDAVGRVVVLQ